MKGYWYRYVPSRAVHVHVRYKASYTQLLLPKLPYAYLRNTLEILTYVSSALQTQTQR